MPDSSSFLAIFDNTSYSNTFTYPYIDGSLATRDASINVLFAHDGGNLYSLADVNIASISDKQFLEYDTATSRWRNRDSLDIGTLFYTKTQIDDLLAQVVGGTY